MKKKLLVFHSALAPYRVDFFNSLGEAFDCKICFLQQQNQNQKFTQQQIWLNQATYAHTFLTPHILFMGRNLNLGFWKAIHDFQPNIVLSNEFGLSLLAPYLYKLTHRSRFRLFTMCDDSVPKITGTTGARKHAIRHLGRHTSGIITVNPEVGHILQTHFGVKRTCFFPIIRNEITYRKEVEQSLPIASEYAHRYGLTDKKIILFVGRLTQVKNLPALLTAWAQIAPSLRGSGRLILVGSGEEEEALKRLAHTLHINQQVIFAGRYEGQALLAWYAVAGSMVLPSTMEPFGAVVAEGLQSGVPALVSTQAGSSCLITPDNGLTVDVNAEGCLREALTHMLNVTPPLKEPALRPNLLPGTYADYMNRLIRFLNEEA